MRDTEAAPDQPGPAEHGFDLFRRRIGGDVEVLRRKTEQHVADTAADEEGFEACVGEALNDAERGGIDQLDRDAVFGFTHPHRFNGIGGLGTDKTVGGRHDCTGFREVAKWYQMKETLRQRCRCWSLDIVTGTAPAGAATRNVQTLTALPQTLAADTECRG